MLQFKPSEDNTAQATLNQKQHITEVVYLSTEELLLFAIH